MRRVLVLLFAVLALSPMAALDYGCLVSLSPGYSHEGFEFNGGVAPWLSGEFGRASNFYLSASAFVDYRAETWSYRVAPERCELTLRPISMLSLSIGRFQFADHSKLVSDGLYDGTLLLLAPGPVKLSFGAFYTGLLEKRSARIIMTSADSLDTRGIPIYYLASPRVLLSLDLAFSLGDYTRRNHWLFFQGMGQFDTREGPDILHSQYLGLGVYGDIIPSLAYKFCLLGSIVEKGDAEPVFSMASSLRMDWQVPGKLDDKLSLDLRWGSGGEEGLTPFIPINAKPQGKIFSPPLSGLIRLELGYGAGFAKYFYAELGVLNFLRSTRRGVQDAQLDPASEDPYLGSEIQGQFRWAPYRDLSLGLSGGVFIPGKPAFVDSADVRWRIAALLLISF